MGVSARRSGLAWERAAGPRTGTGRIGDIATGASASMNPFRFRWSWPAHGTDAHGPFPFELSPQARVPCSFRNRFRRASPLPIR